MNPNQRLKLEDSPIDMMVKMSDGNPGAATVLVKMFQLSQEIDPDSAFGPYTGMISLDAHGIYGSDIYILNNDICEGSVHKSLAVLRAVQLGFFSERLLKDACSRQDGSGKILVPVDDLCAKVKERLPNFRLE